MAAGGGPCIPLASRILKDSSKPWQGTARARIPTCFMAESKIFRNLLSVMKRVGISYSSSLPRLSRLRAVQQQKRSGFGGLFDDV